MEDEEGYMELNLESRAEQRKMNFTSRKQDSSQAGSYQHQIAFWVGWAGNAILLLIVIVLVFQGSFHKGQIATCLNATDEEVGHLQGLPECSPCSEDITYLKSRLCDPTTESSKCELCPLNWVSQREKCYWFSKQRKNWSEARHHCSRRGAQMLVIQDLEEKEFILNISQGKSRLWTGLRFSALEKWIWVDGSLLDHTVLLLSLHADEKSCGAIKDSQFHVEICMDEFEWICEKKVLSI